MTQAAATAAAVDRNDITTVIGADLFLFYFRLHFFVVSPEFID